MACPHVGGLGTWLRTHALVTAAVTFAAGFAILLLADATVAGQAACELVAAAVTLAVFALVAGPQALRPSAAGMALALRAGAYLLALAAAPLVLSALFPGELPAAPAASLPQALASAAALAATVALFEETLFRGLVLGALVERFGHTVRGVRSAAFASSLVFGLMHVVPGLLADVGALTVDVLLQSACRVVTTGAIGLLAAALFLRTHNLWCAMLLHGLNDLLVLIPAFLLGIDFGLGTLADASSSALAETAADVVLTVGSAVATVLYVPVILIALRQLRQVDPADGSVFSARWEPRAATDVPHADAAPPVPPA